ncbi:MAG: FAD-dependent oxidoreductase [Proteobacteria bacterium]|nr:FAD-dependent oxidoreductase [Pseudomonadota bacterium]
MAKKVAIIGAGLAGLSCARTLRQGGLSVDVFEEAAIIGGRIATTCIGPDRFDHGAQYFSPQSDDFRNYIKGALDSGHAAQWTPRVVAKGGRRALPNDAWFVGRPGMSSVLRPFAENLRITVGQRVQSLEQRENGWHLWFGDETSAGPFDAVGVAVPAPEASGLVSGIPALTSALSRARMLPCWALMVRIDGKNFPDQNVFFDVSEIVHWIARDNTKPGRDPHGETLVVHASPFWSQAAQQDDPQDIAEELWHGVSEALGLPPVRPSRMTAYLWRQGVVDQPLGRTHLYCSESKVGLAGDWCLGASAEHAFQSGRHLGRAITAALG